MERNPYDTNTNERSYVYNGSFDEGNKKRRGSDAGCVFLVFFSFVFLALVIGILAQFFTSTDPLPSGMPTLSPNQTHGGNYPLQTPNATYRPLPDYDGKLPVISDIGNPFPDIIDGVKPGVVSICNYANTGGVFGNARTLQGSGTGFLISSEGYIITNAHVIENAASVTIMLSNNKEIETEVIGYDLSSDVAVMKIDNSRLKLPALPLGDSDKIRVGEFVITIGDPSGRELAGSITFGIVSAKQRSVNINGKINKYIQTDAAMNPGNSGGPLINSRGEVIGVNSAKTLTASYDEFGNAINAEGLGFALPINDAIKVAEQLITSGYIQRPGVGVSVVLMEPEELQEKGLENGIMVHSVVEGGPSAQAGLKQGDVIVVCEGININSIDQFGELIRNRKVGDTITVRYWREGEFHNTMIEIGDLNLMG